MKKSIAFEKLDLGKIDLCYAVMAMNIGEKPFLFFGGEGEGSLRVFSGSDFEKCEMIWQGGGGTMSIVPLPGYEGWALASRGFYSMADSAGSAIEIIRYDGRGFSHEPIARLDYLHRFDTLIAPDGTRHIIAASLHGGKKDMSDWSKPGHLYTGIMPGDLSGSFRVDLAPLPGDFYMNHGFCKGIWRGREAAFIASREGVFAVLPPDKADGNWSVEQLLDLPVSDISVYDADGDGEPEIAALMPFHGDRFTVFRRESGVFRAVYTHPPGNDFYHAVICGRINGEPVFTVGARGGDAQLYLVRWDADANAFTCQLMDEGTGPANLSMLNTPDGDYLFSANRTASSGAVYRFCR